MMVLASKVACVTVLLQSWALTVFASAEWTYIGKHGPREWATTFPMCGQNSQSPIDIPRSGLHKESFEAFVFHGYNVEPQKAMLENNGHSTVLSYTPHPKKGMPSVSGGGLPGEYEFAQFHLHWGSVDTQGSEHTIRGKAYPMELHMVHFKKSYGSDIKKALAAPGSDNLAVLGVLFEVQNEDNPKLEPIFSTLAKVGSPEDEYDNVPVFPLADFLPRNTHSFYRYNGSLTTPGCNEVVVWTVFKEPVGISTAQLQKLRKLRDMTDSPLVDVFRPVQPLNGRKVLDVETSTMRFSSSSSTLLMSVPLSIIALALQRLV